MILFLGQCLKFIQNTPLGVEFFNSLLGIRECDETLPVVFDILHILQE